MYPKCPAQSTNFLLQVAQVDILSDTPKRGSKHPPGAGFRDGIEKSSRDVTWNSAKRHISAGDRRPNWIFAIFFGMRSPLINRFRPIDGLSSSRGPFVHKLGDDMMSISGGFRPATLRVDFYLDFVYEKVTRRNPSLS